MPSRFNRHVPGLCGRCTKPLSVRERRAGDRCAWCVYLDLREEWAHDLGGWLSETDVRVTAEEATRTYWISESELFGVLVEDPHEVVSPGEDGEPC